MNKPREHSENHTLLSCRPNPTLILVVQYENRYQLKQL